MDSLTENDLLPYGERLQICPRVLLQRLHGMGRSVLLPKFKIVSFSQKNDILLFTNIYGKYRFYGHMVYAAHNKRRMAPSDSSIQRGSIVRAWHQLRHRILRLPSPLARKVPKERRYSISSTNRVNMAVTEDQRNGSRINNIAMIEDHRS